MLLKNLHTLHLPHILWHRKTHNNNNNDNDNQDGQAKDRRQRLRYLRNSLSLSPSLSLCICVCCPSLSILVFISVCLSLSLCVHVCGLCAHKWKPEEDTGDLLYHFHLIHLSLAVSVNLDLGWWPASPSDPLISSPMTVLGFRATRDHACFFMWVLGSKLRPSCL